jgi:hypothetical protein
MKMILAAAVLAVLALPASAKDNPHGPQWHFMDQSANMNLVIRSWCVPNTRNGRHAHTRTRVRLPDRGRVGGGHIERPLSASLVSRPR